MKTIYLKSQNNINGPLSRFFHFKWGYFIPSLIIIKRHRKDRKFIIDSNGSMVDNQFKAFLRYFNIEFEFKNPDSMSNKKTIIHRLDAHLTCKASLSRLKIPEFCINYLSIIIKNNQIPKLLNRKLLKDLLDVKDFVIKYISEKEPNLIDKYKGKNIIISRLTNNSFKDKIVNHKVKGFGTSRRNLLGVDEFINEMNHFGVIFEKFESGSKTLIEQIIAFAYCNTIVGVRGAEFGNLLWVNKKCKIVFINTNKETSPTFQILKILDLNYKIIQSNNGFFPNLHTLHIKNLILHESS
jgi:hypothetical protein